LLQDRNAQPARARRSPAQRRIARRARSLTYSQSSYEDCHHRVIARCPGSQPRSPIMPDDILTPTRKSSSRAKAPTAAELREFDASPVVHPSSTGMLPADGRAEAEEAAAAAGALVLKALLHRTEPETYPLPRDADSPEAAAVAALAKIDDRTFA